MPERAPGIYVDTISTMTPELEKQVASLIEAAKQTGSDVASFVQQQAPELMEQIVAWKFYDAVYWSSIGVGVGVLGAVLLGLSGLLAKKTDDADWWGPGFTCFVACGALGAVIFCNNINDAIKAKVAPKLVAIEAISELVKK